MAAREVLPSMPTLARQQDFLQPWNVPYSKNPFFTGREEVLADVGKELHASGLAALTGMGGVGKTQIAAHFAHEHRDEYSAVLWASAASQEAMVSGFAAIASLLNLPEKDEKDQALAVAAVKRWLEANGGWLLIVAGSADHRFCGPRLFGPVMERSNSCARIGGHFHAIDDQTAASGLFLGAHAGVFVVA
jgi:hypothetical protein